MKSKDFFIKFKRLLKILEYFCRIEITGMRETELKNFLVEDRIEAGCDEAGRGPLAGPVFAAAVIMPADFHHPLLNDSKQMSARSREILRPIIEAEAIEYAVVSVSAEEIDRMNILNASIAGMQRAVMQLKTLPEHLLIDGNRFRPFSFIASLASDSRSSGKILFEGSQIKSQCAEKSVDCCIQQIEGKPEQIAHYAGKYSQYLSPPSCHKFIYRAFYSKRNLFGGFRPTQ